MTEIQSIIEVQLTHVLNKFKFGVLTYQEKEELVYPYDLRNTVLDLLRCLFTQEYSSIVRVNVDNSSGCVKLTFTWRRKMA